MKKYWSLILIAIGIIISAVSCNNIAREKNTGVKNISFLNEMNIKADSVNMGIIIKPGNIYRLDSFIIVSDVSSNPENHFHVFNKNLDYLYSFCGVGEGPEECLMPTVVKNTSDTTFIVRDHASDMYHKYSLGNDGAEHIGSFSVKKSSPGEFQWEICCISDSVYLAKGVTPKRNIRRLININTGITLDSIPPSFPLSKTLGKDYYSEFDDFWMTANSNRFANAYFFIDRIEFGKISKSKIEITSHIVMDSTPDFFLYSGEPADDKYEYNVDYNIVYYEWLSETDQMLYAGYFGYPWGDISRHSSIIETYTYDGKPVTLYHLDVPLASAVILEKEKEIIGLNPDRSDDYFYIYNK